MFQKILKAAPAKGVEYAGFMNAILECVFTIPYRERGFVEKISFLTPVESERGAMHRAARVRVKRDGVCCFFYVLTQMNPDVPYGWKVLGRSGYMHNALELPGFPGGMIWVDR